MTTYMSTALCDLEPIRPPHPTIELPTFWVHWKLWFESKGWTKIKSILVKEEDECRAWPFQSSYGRCLKRVFCRCFLRRNAYLGIKQRICLCLLILLKPFINYCTAYWEYDDSAVTNDNDFVSFLFRALAIITTVIPLKTMESFHKMLLPYTRMRRSTIKRVFVSFLGPIAQMQQVVIGIAFKVFQHTVCIAFKTTFPVGSRGWHWTVPFWLSFVKAHFGRDWGTV